MAALVEPSKIDDKYVPPIRPNESWTSRWAGGGMSLRPAKSTCPYRILVHSRKRQLPRWQWRPGRRHGVAARIAVGPELLHQQQVRITPPVKGLSSANCGRSSVSGNGEERHFRQPARWCCDEEGGGDVNFLCATSGRPGEDKHSRVRTRTLCALLHFQPKLN
jgi:hypothetical protein